MNTRIEKDFFFQCAVHFGKKFYINAYDVSLSMLVETLSNREQNVAINRITHFITEVLQDSIFVEKKELLAIKKYERANLKICEVPEEPYDQIVAMILLLKLNSIMEGRLKITDMVLGSTMAEGIKYNIVSEVAEGYFSGDHWWNKSCTAMREHTGNITDAKVVKLFDDSKWAELDLTWKEKTKK